MTSDEIRALQRAAENDIPVERRAEYIATLEVALQIALWGERAPTTSSRKPNRWKCPRCVTIVEIQQSGQPECVTCCAWMKAL